MPRSTPSRPVRPAGRAADTPGRKVILGIDPGTLVTGYGVIESNRGALTHVASGIVKNRSDRPMPARLKLIHESLLEVIRKFRPDEVAVETAFYGKNAQSALKLGQARGVAILAAVSGDLPVAEYSPREVKKAVVGNGNASKQQVQYMVHSFLGMKDSGAALDVTDALAVAICHGHRAVGSRKRYADWKSFLRENPDRAKQPGGAR